MLGKKCYAACCGRSLAGGEDSEAPRSWTDVHLECLGIFKMKSRNGKYVGLFRASCLLISLI